MIATIGNSSEQLAALAADVSLDRCPAAVIDKARACVLHALVAALAGADQPCVRQAREVVNSAGRARCLLDGARMAPADAAFVNAVMCHARLQEDAIFMSLHPGSVVIPTALAMAEEMEASGEAFLEAIIAGYEVAARLARGHVAPLAERGFRSTSVFGPAASAVTATLILGGGKEEIANAIGLGAAFALGTAEGLNAGTDEWRFQPAMATRAGLVAARLAMAGAKAATTALDGAKGLYPAFIGSHAREGFLPETSHHILEVGFKPFPLAMINQVPVLMLDRLRLEASGEELESMLVDLSPFEASYPGIAGLDYGSAEQPTFVSIRLSLALTWEFGPPSLATLRRVTEPQVMDAARCVQVRAEPDRAVGKPRIELRTRSGRVLVSDAASQGDPLALGFEELVGADRPLWNETGRSPTAYARLAEAIVALGGAGGVDDVVEAAMAGAPDA